HAFALESPTSTTSLYPFSLHDALPILSHSSIAASPRNCRATPARRSSSSASTSDGTCVGSREPPPCVSSSFRSRRCVPPRISSRSEEHTSELQSRENLVCRLLLEKKKT